MFLLLSENKNQAKEEKLLEFFQIKIFKKSPLLTFKVIFTHPFVENYFLIFNPKNFPEKILVWKHCQCSCLIRYPQFVPKLFYIIFAASFQILEKIQYVNHSDYP